MNPTRHQKAVVDGKIVSVKEAVIPVNSISAQYAFSVYESVKVLKSHAVYLQEHIERLFNSAEGLSIDHHFTPSYIEESLNALIVANNIVEATVRILLTGGDESHIFITSSPLLTYPKSYYERGINVVTYRGERFLPQYKSSSLLMNYLALREGRKQGAFESLLIDRNDYALEGTRSNFFALKDDCLYTAGDKEVLEGVTRSKILTACETLGYSISFNPITFSQLFDSTFDAFFISSTSMGAMPVATIDTVAVGMEVEKIGSIHALIKQWEIDVLP